MWRILPTLESIRLFLSKRSSILRKRKDKTVLRVVALNSFQYKRSSLFQPFFNIDTWLRFALKTVSTESFW